MALASPYPLTVVVGLIITTLAGLILPTLELAMAPLQDKQETIPLQD